MRQCRACSISPASRTRAACCRASFGRRAATGRHRSRAGQQPKILLCDEPTESRPVEHDRDHRALTAHQPQGHDRLGRDPQSSGRRPDAARVVRLENGKILTRRRAGLLLSGLGRVQFFLVRFSRTSLERSDAIHRDRNRRGHDRMLGTFLYVARNADDVRSRHPQANRDRRVSRRQRDDAQAKQLAASLAADGRITRRVRPRAQACKKCADAWPRLRHLLLTANPLPNAFRVSSLNVDNVPTSVPDRKLPAWRKSITLPTR